MSTEPRTSEPVVLTERIHVPIGMMRAIKAHCVENVPFEACGMIGGEGGYCMMLSRCGNKASNPREAFFIDPAHQFKTEKSFTKHGMRVIGIYHSHPSKPARPSLADLGSIPSEMISLIYSVSDDEIVAWRGETQLDIEVIR